jgi:hypothetical protein
MEMQDKIINVYDNFLSEIEHQFIIDYCHSASYFYGETDSDTTPPTGMIHEIYNQSKNFLRFEDTENFFKIFESKIKDNFSSVIETKNLYRMYINCFAPSENPYFHVDGDGYTFLYYPNESWDINEGGETQFFIDGGFYGVLPVPNRLSYFNAGILHKATAFRDRHRFTVAIKYS